jgi:hypothetical protein
LATVSFSPSNSRKKRFLKTEKAEQKKSKAFIYPASGGHIRRSWIQLWMK